MSIRILTNVWDDSKQTGSHLLILLALADFAGDDGTCFPSVKTLAEKTRMTERWVQIALKKISSDGDISVQLGAGPKGSNLYKFSEVYLPKKKGEDGSGGVKMTSRGVNMTASWGEHDGNAYKGNRQKEPSEGTVPGELFKEEIQTSSLREKAKDILAHLNAQAEREFHQSDGNLKPIMNRIKETREDCDGIKQMIDRQCALWKSDPKMGEYLRPETLFNGKFGSYYGARKAPVRTIQGSVPTPTAEQHRGPW